MSTHRLGVKLNGFALFVTDMVLRRALRIGLRTSKPVLINCPLITHLERLVVDNHRQFGRSRCIQTKIRRQAAVLPLAVCRPFSVTPAQGVPNRKRDRSAAGSCPKRSRYGHRDATMILVAYRHGLRASEVCGLRWDQIDLNTGRLHVRRAKGGIDNVHPLSGKEIRALRQLRRENMESRYVFVTERGGPATTAGFLKTIARTGEAAKLPFPIHPHMLRRSTGYKLANDGHDTRALQHYMGHKNIMHTVRYTEMAPGRFKNFWRD